MKYRLGISAEAITEKIPGDFHGIGLLRGEYLCRKINKYITQADCREYIWNYLDKICTLYAPQPVWYRTLEMEVSEINILEGADHFLEEKNTMLGYRGIRRAMVYPETFLMEMQLLAELSKKHANLHLLIPFMFDISELHFVKDCIKKTGFKNKLGIMAEIPSVILCLEDYLKEGLDNITIGINDLSSLILGVYRGDKLIDFTHPAVKEMLIMAREKTQKYQVEISLAGYVSNPLIEFVESIGFDYTNVHYSKLPEVFGSDYNDLPHLENLNEIKRQTRRLIKERDERLTIEKWRKTAT